MIKIGNLDISYFKVGSTDVSAVYLGSVKVYPQGEPPTPVTDFKYKLTLSNGDIVSAATDATSAITRSEISAYSESCVSAEINDCVTNIDASAFLGFTNIRNVSLPNSLTTIGDYAFYHCVKLTGLTIPSGVTTIGQQVLAYTENISSITVEATTPATIGQNAFGSQNFPIYVPCESLSAYQTAWSDYASRIQCNEPVFEGKYKLTLNDSSIVSGDCTLNTVVGEYDIKAYSATTVEAEIGTCATVIGDQAFYGFTNLEKVTIPNTITRININAFNQCSGLTSVDIPDSVTIMSDAAFNGCKSLSSATLSNNITIIGVSVFKDCRNLGSIEIPSGVTEIGSEAFKDCRSLSSITIPDAVTKIGSYAFYNCTGLTTVTLGSGITEIGSGAFGYSNNITSLTIYATTPPTITRNSFTFTGSYSIYVPCESLTLYQQEWDEYASRITCIQPTGHTYVDLGLPSGTKWATMNVGASSETDYGDYYQYGKGASTYQTTSGESDYRSSVDPLPATADTAVQVWGDNWHIPTKTQFEELTANTTFEFTTIDGIAGAKYTAQNGNYIFLPASGVYYNGTLSVLGTYGEYLSSTPNGSQEFYFLMFDSGGKTIYNNHRYLGMPVRPVMDN